MQLSHLRSHLEKGVHLYVPPPESGRDFPLLLSGYGHERIVSDVPLKRLNSDITAFEFIVNGNMIYQESGIEYQVGAGEMFILHRSIPHAYTVGPAGYAHKRYVNIRSTCINSILDSVGLNKPRVIQFESPSRIQALFREIGKKVQAGGTGKHPALSILLYRIILEASSSGSSGKPYAVQKAIAYMTEHLDEKITLDDLAGICGGSVRHFSRQFKQSTGEAPMQWLISLRKNEALRLICQTDLPIGEIARRVGYPDPFGFSAFFKKHMGESPSVTRAKARAADSGQET